MAEQATDDQQLLRSMARGDEAAFGALYARYQRRIFRFAWHMSENSATAEEITQEVFMHLISKPGGYDAAKGSVGAYLFGMARNLTRSSLRQNPGQLSIDEMLNTNEENFADRFDMLAELTRTEMVECLRKAVLALPEQYREVLILRDLEQMGHLETADLLQCSPGTVASRLHRARALLKIRLQNIGCTK